MFTVNRIASYTVITKILLSLIQYNNGMVLIPPVKPPTFFTPPIPDFAFAGGVTSGVISNLAEEALRRRLARHSNVDVSVNAQPTDLIRGRVGPVTVSGNGWCSPMGLSCRMIKAEVGYCSLDLASVAQKQKLHLTVPARGNAMVAFDANDFGSFLTHQLVDSPRFKHDGKIHYLQFLKDNVEIDIRSGSVIFFIKFMEQNWRCTLTNKVDSSMANIAVSAVEANPDISSEISMLEGKLSDNLTDFFNNMILNLSGTYVSFDGMAINENTYSSPTVIIGLNILVKKFPSRKLAF